MMPRIRTVKPELFKHEGLFEAEMASQLPLRIAFIALFSCCDREGRFRWQPKRLKIDMLPYDDLDMAQVLDALVTHGFIKKYKCQGEWYGCIPSWSRHQYINQREAASDLPPLLEAVCHERQNAEIKMKTETNPSVNDAHFSSESSRLDIFIIPDAVVKGELDNNKMPVEISGSQNKVQELQQVLSCSISSLEDCTLLPSQAVARACTCASLPCTCGREGKGREHGRERNNIIVASKMRSPVELEATQHIFEHWKSVMEHPRAKLDPKRRSLIRKALSFGYDVQALCDAITGCSLTPHNRGDNDRNQRYDGLHVILRDSDQIDRFMHNCHYPPRRLTEAERKTKANVQSLQRWVDQKMTEDDVNASV